jgi:chromosome partitioning protein
MLARTDPAPESAFPPIDLSYIEAMEERADRVVEKVRTNSYAPSGRKPSLLFNATQLALLCGKSNSAMARLLDKAASLNLTDGAQPAPNGGTAGKKRIFTQAEAVDWVRAVSDTYFKRPPGSMACTLTIGNFKGGVGKTVASTSIAQALSLMGYKVLAIDLDPQGSMTSLLDVDRMAVDDEQTMLPLARPLSDAGHRDTLQESIQETYWTGIDLVAGSPSLFNAEFYLPMRQMNVRQEPTFRFLEVLDRALSKGIRQEYDYIIIDTPPALSYVTMNAFWAADALLMPLPAEGLDLMSSTRFWSMFTQLARSAEKTAAAPKTFAWIGIVPSKVDHTKQYTKFNLDVMRAAYGENLLNAELPLSSAVSVGGTTLATVYDIQKYVGSKKTYERARVAFDQLAAQIDFLTRTRKWGQIVKETPLQVKL